MLAEVEGAVELSSKRKGVLVFVLQQVHPLSYRNYFITLASNIISKGGPVILFVTLSINRKQFSTATTRSPIDNTRPAGRLLM